MRYKKAAVLMATLTAVAAGGMAIAEAKEDHSAAGLATALAGLTPGQPTACMPFYVTSPSTTAYGPDIVYTVSRSLKYVTHTAGGCERILQGDILVTRQFSDRPCSGDIATTVDPVSRFPTGSCAFGNFVEYKK